MATDVLGQRVHDDIGAVVKGPAEQWRGDGIVDNQGDAGGVGDLRPALDVHHVARRIADGLAEQGPGIVIDERSHALEIVSLGEAGLDALPREGVGKQVVGAAVQLRGADDIGADLRDGLDGVANRRHARSHRQGADPALQRGQARFQHGIGRVHDPAVDIARHLEVEQVRAVLGVIESVGGRLVDGRGGGVGRRVAVIARVQGESRWFHGVVPLWLYYSSAEE